jgi:hypothetical protein
MVRMTPTVVAPLPCPYCSNTDFFVVEHVHSEELWAMLRKPGAFAVRKQVSMHFDLRVCAQCGHAAWFARDPRSLRGSPFIVTEVSAELAEGKPYR